MAYNLLTNYATNTEIKGFVDKYDYYIFPVVNPDGVSFPIVSLTYLKFGRRLSIHPKYKSLVA